MKKNEETDSVFFSNEDNQIVDWVIIQLNYII